MYLLAVLFFADGYFDAYYKRFTTPKKSSLIIGTSRAAQGIVPNIISSHCDISHNEILNYSFNIGTSPFGSIYNHAIFQKLKHYNGNSIFIVTIDPWAVSTRISIKSKDEFRENNTILADLKDFNSSYGINLNYLFNKEIISWGNSIVFQSIKSRLIKFSYHVMSDIPERFKSYLPNGYSYLHDDGWLEVTLKDTTAGFINNRISQKVVSYKKLYSGQFELSEERLNYLNALLDSLALYGEIYLVRMPIHEDIFLIEEIDFPQFSELIEEISSIKNIPFFDFTIQNGDYSYTDGNHLLKTSATKFSMELVKKIKDEK